MSASRRPIENIEIGSGGFVEIQFITFYEHICFILNFDLVRLDIESISYIIDDREGNDGAAWILSIPKPEDVRGVTFSNQTSVIT